MKKTMAVVVLAFSMTAMAWASGCAPASDDVAATPEETAAAEETAQSGAAITVANCPYAPCDLSYSSLPGCEFKGTCVRCSYICR